MLPILKTYGINRDMAANGKSEGENLKTKLIYLPQRVLDGLEVDARRCKRSLVKHIEAILTSYLEIEDIELRDISSLRQLKQTTERDFGTSETDSRFTSQPDTITVRRRSDSSKSEPKKNDKAPARKVR